ncbi:hypothetical protein SEA_TOMAS_85 [Streptomyces phage Tomas]|uniref:Uncharacterized protein n=1 Tax=Streptomyces phage Tomas TaxID=2914443 RepID=A0AA49BS33_9CAUD|nr:hypothetical protein PP453_gp194 [Streptomyces phage Tomas]UMO76273.1 hypothetical protein SEA_TOMAS_85 [Streptomyces phage Tomas]
MEESVKAEDLLRLLLLANGPVTVDRDRLTEAVNDRKRYGVGLTEDPENGEYTFHLIGHDERPNAN